MAKLDAIKEKWATIKAGLNEKLDKITFIQKWRQAKATPTTASALPPLSLGSIYRKGGLGTRLQVFLFYFLAAGALGSTIFASVKIFQRLGKDSEHEKISQEYTHGFGELSQKVIENASLISIGKFTVNVYNTANKRKYMAVDIWVRTSDPTAADFAQKHEDLFYDRVVEAFNNAHLQQVDPLTEEGKATAKNLIIESLNAVIPHGKVEEVFFQNLVVQ